MRAPVFLGLLALAGCASTPPGCEAPVLNASARAVEQLYLAGPAGDWGPDQLRDGELLPGAERRVAFAAPGPWRLRLVWVDGRAAELAGGQACELKRITLGDTALRAE